jgi:hypothetical protein
MKKYILILQYLISNSSPDGSIQGESFKIFGPVEAKNKKDAENKFESVFPDETEKEIINRGKIPYPAPAGCNQILIKKFEDEISIDKNFILF